MARVTRGLTDAALRDRVAQATVGYFCDWAHPCGMAHERSAGAVDYDIDDTVCAGGTGFGIMAQIVAADRRWRPRAEIIDRFDRIAAFLERADRFEGVFPHFWSGATGRALPVFPGDDGGDLVETGFLCMGLLTAAAWLETSEPALASRLEALVHAVDWSAHRRGDDLMWTRSPTRPWTETSLPIRGWNEALVVFVLAAGAPEGAVSPEPYHRSWATAAAFANGETFRGVRLPLGPSGGGGPLFLSQYSFLGLDPRGLNDAYADYGQQAHAHALANRAHCLANPHGWRGYGPAFWGLTAGDDPTGYVAHAPEIDTGVIAPTAALGSFPFVPAEAMDVLRFLHDDRGEHLFGEGGFADGISLHHDWVAASRIAIDQGPIVVALENHRSGLLWRLFMSRPETRRGLAALGFRGPYPVPTI